MKIQDQNHSIRPRRGRLTLLVATAVGALSLAACVPLKGAPPPAPPAAPPTPAIAGLDPACGPEAGANSVGINGSGFSGASGVSFGSTAASFTVQSDSRITAVAPAGAAVVNVQVSGPGGTSANSAADDYSYEPVPTLDSVSPNFGPAAGGNTVFIGGTGLTCLVEVMFGSVPATVVAVDGCDCVIEAKPPAGTNPVDVSVITGGGTTAPVAGDNYTYGPTITSLNPDTGPEAGGTSVLITGTGFTGATDVSFGGIDVVPTVNSSTSITVVAPANAGTVFVKVITPAGESPNTFNQSYRYAPVPTVTSISHGAGGNVAGGNVVSIIGTGLSGTSAVMFGANPATNITVNNDTNVTVTVPASTSMMAGTVDVSVTTPGGTNVNTAGDDYTYFPTPAITGLSPIGGPQAGGNTVTITGSGFTGLQEVIFGAFSATANCTLDDDTQITCTNVPGGSSVVRVTVITLGGTSPNTAADDYTYAAVPTVDGLDPQTGSTAGGETVSVFGTGYQNALGTDLVTGVDFSGTPATCVTTSSFVLSCTTPAHASGFVTVRVTTFGGSSPNNNPNDFFLFT